MKRLEKGLTLTEINPSRAKDDEETIVIGGHTYLVKYSGVVRSGSRKLLIDAVRDLLPYTGGNPTKMSLKFKANYGGKIR